MKYAIFTIKIDFIDKSGKQVSVSSIASTPKELYENTERLLNEKSKFNILNLFKFK